MVDEFRYVEGKVKGGLLSKARRLEHFRRYQDDCTVCNFDEFPVVCADIYPPSLTLTQENDDNQLATVLDMDVKIDQGSFITRVYCKTDDFPFNVISFPFLESNINERICYLFFYGQVLRFQWLSTYRSDFESRCRKLEGVLIARGYNRQRLGREFCRVIGKYLGEFQRWEVPLNFPYWFNLILA